MKTVLVVIAPGFEEIETITVVDILRRAGARVTLAGTAPGILKGSRNIKLEPDENLDNIGEKEFDLICLPGGQPGTEFNGVMWGEAIQEIDHKTKKVIWEWCSFDHLDVKSKV